MSVAKVVATVTAEAVAAIADKVVTVATADKAVVSVEITVRSAHNVNKKNKQKVSSRNNHKHSKAVALLKAVATMRIWRYRLV